LNLELLSFVSYGLNSFAHEDALLKSILERRKRRRCRGRSVALKGQGRAAQGVSPGRIAKSEKTAKDAKSAKEQSIKNSYFHRLMLFFLGALGGSKINFAIILAATPS